MYTCIYNYSENIRRKKKIVLSIGRRLHVAGKFKNRQAAGGGGGDGKEEKIQVEQKKNLSTNDSLMENRNYRGAKRKRKRKTIDLRSEKWIEGNFRSRVGLKIERILPAFGG